MQPFLIPKHSLMESVYVENKTKIERSYLSAIFVCDHVRTVSYKRLVHIGCGFSNNYKGKVCIGCGKVMMEESF